MSDSSDKHANMLIKLIAPLAVERFIAYPDQVKRDLDPVLEKLYRLRMSRIILRVQAGTLDRVPYETLRAEVDAFVRYARELPKRYMASFEPNIDWLDKAEVEKQELGECYLETIIMLMNHFDQLIRDKYSSAIRVTLEYNKNHSKLESDDEEYRSKWLSSRRHEEVNRDIELSELPKAVFTRLNSNYCGKKLADLSLVEVHTVAHALLLSITMGETAID